MNFSLRNIIIGLIVIVLAVAIPVTVRLAQQQQQLKSKAEGCNPGICQLYPTIPSECGDTPAGLGWKVANGNCGVSVCSTASECPQRSSSGGQGWCYYFDDVHTCLTLDEPNAPAPPGGGQPPGVTGAARCTTSWSTSSSTSGSITAQILNSDGSPDLGAHTYDNVELRLDGVRNNLEDAGGLGRYRYNIPCSGQQQGQRVARLWFPSVGTDCEGSTIVTVPACGGGPGPGPGTGGPPAAPPPGGGTPSTTPPGGSISFNNGQTSGSITRGGQVTVNYSAWSNSGSLLAYAEAFARCINCSDTGFKLIGNRSLPQNYISDSVNWTPDQAGNYQVVVNVVAQDGSKCSGNPDRPSGWPPCGNTDKFTLTVRPATSVDPAKRCCGDANRRIFSRGAPTQLTCHGEQLTGSADNCNCAGSVTPNCYRCDASDPQQDCFTPSPTPPPPPPVTCPTTRTQFNCTADGRQGTFWCYGGTQANPGVVQGCSDPNRSGCWDQPTGGARSVCNISGSTPTSPPVGGQLACTRFELSGLSQTGTNSEGGPIYTASSAGSNNLINMTYTPDSATVNMTPTTQTSGAPPVNISQTNTGTALVRTANIPPNSGLSADNIYMIRGTISNGISNVSCLPIQVIVPKTTTGTACPADITSTEVKFKNSDNSGSWVTQKTIAQNQQAIVAGFHNGQTNVAATGVTLSFSGPQGFSGTHQNGALFTPPQDLPPGSYVFTATTNSRVGSACIGNSTLTVQQAQTPSPPPPPPVFTQCVIVSEDRTAVNNAQSCTDPLARPYDNEPLTIANFRFQNTTPGIKTVFVKFISTSGVASQIHQRSINFNPDPRITDVNCTQASSGVGTVINIIGTNLGSQGVRSGVKLGSEDAIIDSWDSSTNTIIAHVDRRVTGRNDVRVTLDDGRVTQPLNCTVNTATAAFKVAFACRSAGGFATSGVDVKVYEAVPANAPNPNPDPILNQKISLNSQGEPQGFSPIFQKNKKYQLIVKAPGTLAKRADFNTNSGGTVNLNGGNPIFLPQGDIAPLSAPDGKINAFDKSELSRQWALVTDVTRTGDLNGDSRVNSVDYACMRPNINLSDEGFSPIAPSTSPTPVPRPSTSPSPGGGVGFGSPTPVPATTIPYRASLSPLMNTIDSSGTANATTGVPVIKVDSPAVPPGVYTVYVQYFINGVWQPVPPQVVPNFRIN